MFLIILWYLLLVSKKCELVTKIKMASFFKKYRKCVKKILNDIISCMACKDNWELKEFKSLPTQGSVSIPIS